MGDVLVNRIAEARNRAGLTQQQVADALDISVQGYQYYEYGKRDPKASVIRRMCEIFGVSAAYLLGIDNDPAFVPNREHVMHRMPVVGRIAAGEAREAIEQADEWHATRDELWRGHERAFWLVVAGNSMNRLFPDGSLVMVDPDMEVRDGDVGAIFVNGDDATLKRVFYEGDSVRLHPESWDIEYKDRTIDRSDPAAPEVRVVGRVVSYTAPDGWRA